MREALFIKKNKDRWLKNQQSPPVDPDEIAKEFTQTVEDLAYAKTFYPSGKITQFINAEASRMYLDIYRNRKEESNRIVRFWKYDLPLTLYKHRRALMFSFIIFAAFFAFGYFAASQDESFASAVLGPGYVAETKQNIAVGNPFGIYETGTPFWMWMYIMINNIKVTVIMFFASILGILPGLFLLSKNAVMTGVFDEFFASRGLGINFWMVVFVHGTLEISAIILSGGAGLVLGKSFIFPGTISRMESFKQGAKDGVKIIVGMMPVLALAAFFESFITRLYNDFSILTTSVFGLSVVFVIWYFVIYPHRLGRKLKAQLHEEESI